MDETPVLGCLACDVLSGRVVAPGGVIYEDDHWVVDHSTSPVVLTGFVIIKPKRHVEHVGELNDAEAAALGPLLRDVSCAVRTALGAEKVYACSFGEAVGHVHWYVVPRYAGMPAQGPAVVQMMFSAEHPWAASDEAAAEAADKVRAALAGSQR
jgi:diadenosine tetraphosphate (Ap4A) HIT family hydrolase